MSIKRKAAFRFTTRGIIQPDSIQGFNWNRVEFSDSVAEKATAIGAWKPGEPRRWVIVSTKEFDSIRLLGNEAEKFLRWALQKNLKPLQKQTGKRRRA